MSDPRSTSPNRPLRLTPWEAVKLPSLRNFTFAVLLAVLCAGVAAAVTLRRAPEFRSLSVVLFDQPAISQESSPAPLFRVNALRKKYVALVPTEVIAGVAAERLQVPQGVVARSARALINADSLVMYISAESRSRRNAQLIADEVTTALIEYAAAEQDEAQVQPSRRVTIEVVDHADPGIKVSPTTNDAISAAAFAGIVALVAAYVLLQLVTAGRRLPLEP